MATPRGSEHRDLEQRFRDLEQQLAEVRDTLLRRDQLKVDEGDFVVSGGGSIVAQHPDGSLMYYGPLSVGGAPATNAGLWVTGPDPDNESVAFFGARTDGGSQAEVYDVDGTKVFEADSSGKGLARPNVHYWLHKADENGYTTSAGSFQTAYQGYLNLWSPRLVCRFSSSTSQGTARLVVDGTGIGSVSWTSSQTMEINADLPASAGIGQTVYAELQIRSDDGSPARVTMWMLRGGAT